MRAQTLVGLFGFVGLLAGCSAAPATDGATATSAEALSTRSSAFVTLKADARKCRAPLCGGYFVQDANRSNPAQYVGSLDFSRSGFDDATIAKVTSAPANELLLKGKLGPKDDNGVRSFVVTEAYRGMPGKTYDASVDSFLTAANFVPPHECFAAPCDIGTATEVNTYASDTYDRIDVTAASVGFIDQAWLTQQIAAHGAIVAGNLVTGATTGVRPEQVLAADQVFVKLPIDNGSCPKYMHIRCSDDTPVEAWTRTADMCLVPDGCAPARPCSMMLPYCPDGYTLDSWKAQPNGCSHAVCDPTFVVQ